MLKKLLKSYLMFYYKNKGLQIGENSVIIGKPILGSEPYLVSIGRNVTISANVSFITHDGGTRVFRKEEKFRKVIKYGRITIEDNCFVGLGSVIMPGVKIGSNSVVAAGSIVTKNIPSGTVYGGNPAKFIMTTTEYANKCMSQTPNYDIVSYKKNKKNELLKLFPFPW